MGTVEAVESEIARVNAAIEALEPKIVKAEGKAESAENAGNADAANRWFTELQQLRKDKEQLRKEKEQLREEKARLQSAAAAGPSTTGTDGPQPAQQLQLPEELLAFLRRAIQKETSLAFADEISVGGSKMDLSDAREALVRMGFEKLETIIGVADDAGIADADSGARFEWKGVADAREDDTSNMIRAEDFVRAALAAHVEGFTVVDICQRQIFSRSDATPTKRMKLRDTRTDLAVVMTEFAELAKLNPRNYLAQIAGIVDTKTERAWKESHDAFQGQALGQFVGCTLLSGHSGVGFPVLLTNLVGDSHVFHGVQEEGGSFVQEVVFSDQAAAFQYFGKVCTQAEVVRRKKVTELLAALDNRPPRLSGPPSSSPFRNPLDSPQSHRPVDSDLRECAYREVRREQPQFNLPPFEIMMEYLSNLEQGVARAAEIRSRPSYII